MISRCCQGVIRMLSSTSDSAASGRLYLNATDAHKSQTLQGIRLSGGTCRCASCGVRPAALA